MSSKYDLIKDDVVSLIAKANLLRFSMQKECGLLNAGIEKRLSDNNITLLDFKQNYEQWYTEALLVVKQLIPDRMADFIKQYNDKYRKQITNATYTVSDYLIGILMTNGFGETVVEPSAAFNKMNTQCNILESVQKVLESSLYNIKELVQADLFDSELDAATELVKKGFTRGAGAIAGVVLEKHLHHVCDHHQIKIAKKNHTISDYYQILKEKEIIDVPQWRFIQHLGDLRNLCDHNKDKEPSKEQVTELIEGVDKVVKTIF